MFIEKTNEISDGECMYVTHYELKPEVRYFDGPELPELVCPYCSNKIAWVTNSFRSHYTPICEGCGRTIKFG